jgi:hypothetical protein
MISSKVKSLYESKKNIENELPLNYFQPLEYQVAGLKFGKQAVKLGIIDVININYS